jgi:hypothetical protein
MPFQDAAADMARADMKTDEEYVGNGGRSGTRTPDFLLVRQAL